MKAAALVSHAILAALAFIVLLTLPGRSHMDAAILSIVILSSIVTLVAVVRPFGPLSRRLVIALNSAFVFLSFAVLAGLAAFPFYLSSPPPLARGVLGIFAFALPYCFSLMVLRRQLSNMEGATSKDAKMTLSKIQLTGIVVLTAVLSAATSGYVMFQMTGQILGVLVLDNTVNDLRVVSTSLMLLRDDRRDRVPGLLCNHLEDIALRAKRLDSSVHKGIFPLWGYSNSQIAPNLERIERYRATTIDAKFEKC